MGTATSRLLSIYLLLLLQLTIAQVHGQTQFQVAKSAFERGDYNTAAIGYQQASEDYLRRKDRRSLAVCWYNLAMTYHAMGQFKLAFETLDSLGALAEELGDHQLQRKARALFATVAAFSRKSDLARENFDAALRSALTQGADEEAARIANDFGSFLASEGEYEEGIEFLDAAIEYSGNHKDHELLGKSLLNRSLLYLNAGLEIRHRALRKNSGEIALKVSGWLRNARRDVDRVVSVAKTLGESESKATLLTSAAEIYKTLADSGEEPLAELTRLSFASYQQGIDAAKSINNRRALSYALGGISGLYEEQGRLDEGLRLARAARDLAQETSSPDSLFQWEWSCGRILSKLNRTEEAIESYDRARKTFQEIRHDVAISHGKRKVGKSFREAVGPLFFENAGLLVAWGKTSKNPAVSRSMFIKARDVIEEFKSAELEDYFQDDCVNLFLSKEEREVEDPAGNAAVIYWIPLEDRTHILVNIAGKMFAFESRLRRKRLMSLANQFRESLENQVTFVFSKHARALYEELIRPAEGVLQEYGVRTLIFVPDGELRTVPPAAFYDGRQFLIERYAVAVTPGLRLMKSKHTDWNSSQVLIGALTAPVAGFPGLGHVRGEVNSIESSMSRSSAYIDAQFRKASFVEMVQKKEHQIVHIASHGEFGKDSKSSFVLTHDGKIDLDEMERMIKPRKFDGSPVELLTLSACRTATGDDRAALGLAGIAVKSGARSVVASLWYIDDETTSEVMKRFYMELARSPGISKSEALRRAQTALIDSHPCFWSPFIVIGDWQ